MTALPPIPTVGLTKDDVEDLMNRTYQVMLAQYNLSSAEVQANAQLAIEQKLSAATSTAAALASTASPRSRNNLGGAAEMVEKMTRRADEVRFDGNSMQMSAQPPLAV